MSAIFATQPGSTSQSKPDEIYHLAAIAHVPTSYRDPRLTFEVNLYGSLNLFEVVKLISRDIKVLYVGSASEYGDVREEKIPINEDVLLRPVDPYSVSKASTDLLAYQYFKSFDMHIVRVRPFNHIGPRQSPDYVVSSFAKQIAEIEKSLKEPVITVGNLEAKRDFTDVRDMVRAYWLALQKGEPGEVYNICSGKAVSIQEVLDKLLKLSDKEIKIEQDVERLRPADIPLSLGDSTKFRKKTGWKPGIPFEKTLRDTLDYWSGKVDK
jgi:GDP-4-dehydro-6-deoxy-D-mannose reductase